MSEEAPSFRTLFDEEDIDLIRAACKTKMAHHQWKANQLDKPDRNLETVTRHENAWRRLQRIIHTIDEERI
jgi:hypothetical protein